MHDGRPVPHPTSTTMLSTAVLVLGLAAAGCAPPDAGEMSADREAALADTLRSVVEEVDAAWQALAPGPYLAHYSEDAHVYYQGDHLPRPEFDSVVDAEMGRVREFSTEMQDLQVEVLGPDAGAVSFRYRAAVVDTAGTESELTAAVTVVLERRDGEWKVVQAHESFPPPGAGR